MTSGNADYAFRGCSSLVSLKLPNGITGLYQSMLTGCSSLQSLTIPASVTIIEQGTFYDCTSLKFLTIEDGTSDLNISYNYYVNSYTGFHAFSRCPLESVYLGRNIINYYSTDKYGYAPFYNKTTLTSLTIGENVTSIPTYLFAGCSALTSLTIPGSVTKIADYAFQSCTNLSDLTFSEGIETIGERAFQGCTSLTSVTFPSTLTTIKYSGFSGTALSSIDFSTGIKSIEAYAFGYCDNLTSLYIPGCLTDISAAAFSYSRNITSIVVAADHPKYDSRGNCNAIIDSENDALIVGCVNTVIPNDVKKVGGFYGCKNLTSITIPDGVIEVGGFRGCSGLTTITIPESVETIEDRAFSGCTSLTDFYCHIKEPPYVELFESNAIANATLHVPASSIDAYCQAYSWKGFGNFATLEGTQIEVQEVEINGIKYQIAINAKVIYNSTNKYTGDIMIPSTISVNGKSYSVTSIGENAFSGCTGLTSVSIPSSVTRIGRSAFYSCSALTSISLPSGLSQIFDDTFYGCSKLSSIAIPYNVTTIGESAFYDCSGLQSVTIGRSVRSIEEKAFYRCFNLSNIYISDLSAWCSIDFSSGSHPFNSSSGSSLSHHIFLNGTEIKSLTIPSSITSIKNLTFYRCDGITSITIPSSVTSIGREAFSYCSGLTSINIPRSVTSVGDYALSYCTSLSSVSIPNSITNISDGTFKNCTALTSITIPNSVTIIGKVAINTCTSLTSITIPSSVTSIGDYAFAYNTNLTSVISEIEEPCNITNQTFTGNNSSCILSVPSGTRSAYLEAGWKTFGGGIIDPAEPGIIYIPAGNTFKAKTVEGIDMTFRVYDAAQNILRVGNNSVSIDKSTTGSITIPQTVTYGGKEYTVAYIGSSAFSGCSGLISVTIPGSVTSIESSAFSGCTGLTSITIPESVTSISGYAFDNCTGLASVTITDRRSIAKDAFYGCTGIKAINIKMRDYSSLASNSTLYSNIPSSAKWNYYINDNLVTVLDIPSNVTSIGSYALYKCTSLTSVSIPNSVEWIGHYSFYGCSGLTSINIPNSVTSIGNYAFYNCSGLTSVTIPSSVTSIGNYAFYGCSGLTTVKVDIATPLSISSSTFSNRNNITLYVPAGSGSSYSEASYWQDFNIVEFIEGDVNSDGETDVVDVVDIARYVVGTPAETFVPILADINNNGEVNVGDAVALVNEIAGDQNFVKPWRAPQQNSVAGDVLTLISTDNGMSLCMENERNYTAFQFDLFVPEGTDVAQMLLNAQRKQKHQLLYNKVEEGHYRVAAISTSNRMFQGNDGELLSFALDSDIEGEISIRNIHFFDTKGGDYMFNEILYEGTTTGIAVTPSTTPMDGAFYTIDGRRIGEKPTTKGLYIVNGKKVVIK